MISKNELILITLLGLFYPVNLHAQWMTEKCPTSTNLNAISLLNDTYGWIVGDNGTLLYKFNNEWIKYPNITNENLHSVFIVDKKNVWAVGSNGTIIHFDGSKWELSECPTNDMLYSVSFMDVYHGIAVGAYGTILLFENGTWNLAPKTIKGNLYAVSTKGNLSVIGGGLEWVNIPIMTMTHNERKKLASAFDPQFVAIRSLAITEQNNIWAVGRPGTIFHYNGNLWTRVEEFEKLPSLNSVFFSDEFNGITVGHSGTILTYSEDGWKKEISTVNVKLNNATISGNTFYAVGNMGTILSHKRDSENTFGSDKTNTSSIEIEAYPNPSRDVLNLRIPDESEFIPSQVTVTNAYGQVVFTENISSLTGGQLYEVNTSGFSTGLYIVNVTSPGNRAASGKFIVKH